MRLIERFIKKEKNIVHGRKALNKQMPPQYWRETSDWDLFSPHSSKDANLLQKFLDKEAAQGQDRFFAKSVPLADSKKKVWKVLDREVGNGEVADFMETPRVRNLYKPISGIRYERLQRAKQVYKRILANPKLSHRHDKASFDLNSIEQYERDKKLGRKNKGLNLQFY